jgi:hypothetical protein
MRNAEFRMPNAGLVAAIALVGAAATPRTAVGDTSMKDVLRRMGAYVHAYGEKASIVVATERYSQHITPSGRNTPADRATVADFAIVKAQGLGGWVGFRDVVEVDGTRLVDHRDRLLEMLSSVSGSFDEAQRLSDESARFNLGPIARNFNVPTAALFFFRPESLERFKFARGTVMADGVWEITFRETARPTLVRTPEGRSVPSEGGVWVNPADGTILRTRLRMTEFERGSGAFTRGSASAQVDVRYANVSALGMWLPDVMTESYEVGRGVTRVRLTTEARYSEYRRFQTSGRIK